MLKRTFLFLLFIFCATAAAEEPKNTKSIYEELRKSQKPTSGASTDDITTATIKRHMATLLYPVDLSSLKPPEQDESFKGLIKLLQRQMGDPDTGIITSDQYYRLAGAARDIDARPVLVASGKIISMEDEIVLAVGTGQMDDLAQPINKVRIVCVKSEGTCEEAEATFDAKTGLLDFFEVASYQVRTWTPKRVTAIREHPCGTATMSIDIIAKTVEVSVLGHKDLQFCPDASQERWSLVDGFPVAWNLARDKQLRAGTSNAEVRSGPTYQSRDCPNKSAPASVYVRYASDLDTAPERQRS
jgi:hypothetical protein